MSPTFEEELVSSLNRYSIDSASNTPYYILVQFLLGCLAAFNQAVQEREMWYGHDDRPSVPHA